MSVHTPGPWVLSERRILARAVRVNEHFAIAPEAGPTFAYLPVGREDAQRANARLIAAAPDLLAALRAARDFTLESDRARNTPGWEQIRGQVESAIAKAEGK